LNIGLFLSSDETAMREVFWYLIIFMCIGALIVDCIGDTACAMITCACENNCVIGVIIFIWQSNNVLYILMMECILFLLRQASIFMKWKRNFVTSIWMK